MGRAEGEPLAVTVTVRVPVAAVDAVSGLLWSDADLGVLGVEERSAIGSHVELVVSLADHAHADLVTTAITGAGGPLAGVADAVVGRDEVVDDSWLDAWREHARPVRAGRHLVIVPVDLDDADSADSAGLVAPSAPALPVGADDLVVAIDPGRAFGSGAHVTTRLVLALLEEEAVAGAAILDVGCGSGVLAVAAALLGAARVEAIDVDAEAVRATGRNARHHRLEAVITASATPVEQVQGAFDLVLANIGASVLVAMAPALARRTAPAGRLLLSGVLDERRAEVEASFAGNGLDVVAERADEGWVGLALAHRPTR
ncbi:MAG: 50S ribosomal protein L11 methyltransferase [Acidimicrobiales bacterium]